MNSTSPSSSWVRMAARSPARSSAGPDVTCRCASSSVAMMSASVVLPRPGGPANSRWSGAWPRRRAASSRMSRWALSSAWPTNSASRRGRSAGLGRHLVGAGIGIEQLLTHGRHYARGGRGQRQASERLAQQLPRRRRRRASSAVAPRISSASSRARPAPRARRCARTAGRWRRPRRRSMRGASRHRRRGSIGHVEARLELDQQAGRRLLADARAPGTGRRRRRRPGCATSAAGACTDRMASASDGPTPWAPSSASKVTRSSRRARSRRASRRPRARGGAPTRTPRRRRRPAPPPWWAPP